MVDFERAIIMAEEALAEYEDNLSFAQLALSKATAEVEDAKKLLIKSAFDQGRMYGRWSNTYDSLPQKYKVRFDETHFAKPRELHRERLADFTAALGEFSRRAVAVGVEQKKRDDAKDRLERLRDFAEGGDEIFVY